MRMKLILWDVYFRDVFLLNREYYLCLGMKNSVLFLMFPTSVIRSELVFLHLLASQRDFLIRDSGSTFAIAHKHFESKEDIVLAMLFKMYGKTKMELLGLRKTPAPLILQVRYLKLRLIKNNTNHY